MGDTRAQAIRISAPILIDSGYRRGTDIAKALALGANAVLLGRTSLYGLAAAGEAGVDHVLHLLKDEVERRLAQIGCPSVSELSPDWGRKGSGIFFLGFPTSSFHWSFYSLWSCRLRLIVRAQSERQSRADDCEYQ